MIDSALDVWHVDFPKLLSRVPWKRGIPFIKHSEGNLNPILRDLVETGIDGLHSIEPIAGMDA